MRYVEPLSGPLLRMAAVLVVVVVLVTLGCHARSRIVPRQQWDEEQWGPLVPHESFPEDCSLCHIAKEWTLLVEDFQFDHAAETGFALEGAHNRAACLRCHNDRGPVQLFLERGCGGCHLDPHEGVLGTECDRCHDQLSWVPRGLLAEHGRTRFPLTGVHLGVACDRCHPGAKHGAFEGAPAECHLCHQDDLRSATSLDHVAQGWVRDCQQCHTPRSVWGGGNFRHAIYPLIGAHAQADCVDCHRNNVFRGTPRACFACHSAEYQAAVMPDHAASGYPTNCEVCHSTFAWSPASFDHSRFFPIDAGDHAALDCTDCHGGGSFVGFTCVSCHEHSQGQMDPEHAGVNGYVFSSPACLACHPDGRE